jgi:hypothetical protein
MASPYVHFDKITKRNCLKCGKPFGSVSKFHKVCEPCNQENELVVNRIKNFGISSFYTTGD